MEKRLFLGVVLLMGAAQVKAQETLKDRIIHLMVKNEKELQGVDNLQAQITGKKYVVSALRNTKNAPKEECRRILADIQTKNPKFEFTRSYPDIARNVLKGKVDLGFHYLTVPQPEPLSTAIYDQKYEELDCESKRLINLSNKYDEKLTSLAWLNSLVDHLDE